jgi:PAS domain S-box-containing protein
MIAVVDREYRYLIANRQFLNRRNMKREQVVGHYAHEVLSSDFFERVAKARLDECFQGKVVRYETKYTYPELGERDLIISYFPIEGAGGIDRVACIMHDITDRKRGEEALHQSEQRFRLAAEAGKMYSFEWDVATGVVVRSPERVKVIGASEPLRLSHEQFMNTVHSDDRPNFIAAIARLTPEKPTAEVIYRLQNSDGSLVCLRSCGRAFFDSQGKLLRVIGMVADITDLKRAEEAASGMTRKLVEAQEQERARIGRELHDDITQRLTLLSLKMEEIDENPSNMRSHLAKLRADMIQISTDIEALSRELHSTKLHYLGLVAATKSWCREFGDRHKVRVIFTSNISSNPSFEVGRSLFRILQEATSNAVKYSGIDSVEVRLWDDASEIHLRVHDSGRGFDVNVALQGEGLGLTSMRERVRLINGTISIDSMPNRGTTIYVHVPLPKEQDSHRWAV